MSLTLITIRELLSAHDIGELNDLRWGVSQARRAWIGPESVVNTRSRADLLAWAAGKAGRV